MFELRHCSCLLQELDFAGLIRRIRENLAGQIQIIAHSPLQTVPNSPAPRTLSCLVKIERVNTSLQQPFINSPCPCSARITVLGPCVWLCVCFISALRTTKRMMSHTNGFCVTSARKNLKRPRSGWRNWQCR